MKKPILKLFVVAAMAFAQSVFPLYAQTVSTFESLQLPLTQADGSNKPLGMTFTSGDAIFYNYFDTSYGGFWSTGWAYSNVKDSVTAGYANTYGSRAGGGYNGSANYIVGKDGAVITLKADAIGKPVSGFYVTNTTFAALSMKEGDLFAKKFGGASGDDSDWFKLTVKKWEGGVLTDDSVDFYLADYRFADNTQDYIVTDWQWVDLTSLGNADSLKFVLSSSDASAYGINTPAYFCIDNFTAQTVADFESLSLPINYWNGVIAPLGATFKSGNAIFPNYYDTSYGGFWTSGWAYSAVKDSVTTGYLNSYASRAGGGYDNSNNYAIGQNGAVINLNAAAIGKVVNGFYVTNSTYAAFSIKEGDAFGKQFGGRSGNDADWFKITVRKWYGGVLTGDSVGFYLADYRFADNTKDYIVTNWQWVNLTSLGNVDSLKFILTSSDVNANGINTPGYFCMDNFTTSDMSTSVNKLPAENLSSIVYPNPATDMVNINLPEYTGKNLLVQVTDVTGKIMYSAKVETSGLLTLNLKEYPAGIYFLSIKGGNSFINKKIIKE